MFVVHKRTFEIYHFLIIFMPLIILIILYYFDYFDYFDSYTSPSTEI